MNCSKDGNWDGDGAYGRAVMKRTLDLIASMRGGKDRGIHFFLDDVTALNVNSVKMNRA